MSRTALTSQQDQQDPKTTVTPARRGRRWLPVMAAATGAVLALFCAGAGVLGTGAAQAATAKTGGGASTASGLHPVSTPSWWDGMCDAKRGGGGYEITSWNGLIACGPQSTGLTETGPLHPNAEWQCVELSERWLYQEWGWPVVAVAHPANGTLRA